MESLDPARAAEILITYAARAAGRGWTPATAGNFSVRVDERRAAITRSGVDKGALTAEDVLLVEIDGPADPRASAEAPLHLALYRDADDIGAVFHVHSPSAAVVSRLAEAKGAIRLQGWELQKALAGVRSHESAVEIAVFGNDQDTAALAGRVSKLLAQPCDAARAPGYLLAGHGLYAWGAQPADAWRHLEALEALLAQELAFRREGL